jgi:hypothetical protein
MKVLEQITKKEASLYSEVVSILNVKRFKSSFVGYNRKE